MCCLSSAKADGSGCSDHGCVIGAELGPGPVHFYPVTNRSSRQVVPERLVTSDSASEKDPSGLDALGGLDGIAREDIHDRLLEAGRDVRHQLGIRGGGFRVGSPRHWGAPSPGGPVPPRFEIMNDRGLESAEAEV